LSSEIEPETKKQILKEEFEIVMTTEIESEVADMCNLSDGIEKKGIEIGTKTTKLQDIQNLMKNLKLSMEQAMTALEVPETEKEKYADMLKE